MLEGAGLGVPEAGGLELAGGLLAAGVEVVPPPPQATKERDRQAARIRANVFSCSVPPAFDLEALASVILFYKATL